MSSYDLLRKRLNALGGNQEGRMKMEKLKTLKKALLYSEQAETVIKDGIEYRAILNKNKQKIEYDDKNISIPFEAGFKIGDTFHWVEEGSNWIIYLKEGQDAYFTGICRRAMHTLRWKDEFGVVRETLAAVRGPAETKIKSEMKSGIAFDQPNYTLYLILPYNEETAKLKRYSKVALADKMWEVAVVDSISEPGIMEAQLTEEYIHREEDKDLITPGEGLPNLKDIEITCSLDSVPTLEMNEPFKLWVSVEKDGISQTELIDNAIFTLDETKASISGDFVTPIAEGELTISLEIPKLKYKKDFVVNVINLILPAVQSYEIRGDEKVKSFGENTYTIKHFVDGFEGEVIDGFWKVDLNKSLFSIASNDKNQITFKWAVGSHGRVELQYVTDGEVVATKEIKVESLI